MNSGIRLTVALLLVAFIGIGFYFASLEDADGPKDADITRDPDPARFAVVEPVAPVEAASEPPAMPETTDADNDDPDPLGLTPAPGIEDEIALETAAETVETDGIPEDPTSPEAVTTEEATDLGSVEAVAAETAIEPAAPAYGPSRGVRASGIYLLKVVSPEDSRIDVEAARSSLRSSIDPRPAGPTGTAWVPIADWCSIRGDGELQGILLGTRPTPDGEARFLLVRDDDALGLRLDGRVSDADAFENNEGRPRVAFLLESDAVDEVREASFAMVGDTVAWIVDGEVISTPPLEVAIQNRGRLHGGFDLEHARWIAARLRGEMMPRPGTPDPEIVLESEEVPRSAAELPASAYSSYTIEAGDNFERIAVKWFGDPRKQSLIAIANPTVDPIRLQIGQVIKLPPKDTPLAIERSEPTPAGVVVHVVRSGETLSDIAEEYLGKAARWREIHDVNRDVIGDDPARLRVGMELRIP